MAMPHPVGPDYCPRLVGSQNLETQTLELRIEGFCFASHSQDGINSAISIQIFCFLFR